MTARPPAPGDAPVLPAAPGRSPGLVWLSGSIVPAAEAAVPAADRGFLLGDGLFETLRARGARVFRLAAHLERMARGAHRLAIPLPGGIASVVAELLEAGGLPEAALRITLTRGPGGEGLEPPSHAAPTLAIWLRPAPAFPPHWYERGLALRTASQRLSRRSPLAGVKTTSYLPNVLALVEARAAGADDALLLDDRDWVVEASASNLFWVSAAGELRTPSAACGILPGVTRAAVLELVGTWGAPAVEGEWEAVELIGAREAFATSSLRGVVPVTSLDGRPVGDGMVGELTRAVMEGYEALVLRETGLAP